MVINNNFTVIDFETTGLYPESNDRIVEVAAIQIDHTGNILKEYTSLVNPNRDVGLTYKHKITARDVLNAPRFEEIAGDVISLLSDSVFVAHGANFDLRFISKELSRMGYTFPDYPFLCTMQLARRADRSIPSRKLGRLCNYFGINLTNAHEAYHDAIATAELFSLCLSKIGGLSELSLSDIGVRGDFPLSEDLPQLHVSGKSYKREKAALDNAVAPPYISRLVAKLPATNLSNPLLDEYNFVLDQVLEDRRIEESEFEKMLALANDLGVSREDANRAHHAYMRNVINTALEDSIITENERKDLDEVRKLLSISHDNYASILNEVRVQRQNTSSPANDIVSQTGDVEGKSICFTGSLNCLIEGERATKSMAQKIAAGHGMLVEKNVTKKLDILVVADPYSMSGKAKKAREYGTRIIAEHVFWKMMGTNIE